MAVVISPVALRISAGASIFGSNVSNWVGPPCRNRKMTLRSASGRRRGRGREPGGQRQAAERQAADAEEVAAAESGWDRGTSTSGKVPGVGRCRCGGTLTITHAARTINPVIPPAGHHFQKPTYDAHPHFRRLPPSFDPGVGRQLAAMARPKNDGISAEKGLPTEWSTPRTSVWKLPLPGMGSSTPCVWGNKIFLTSADEANSLWALCVSTDGKELWRITLGQSASKARRDEGNAASPSPSTDGKHVWFCVGSGDVACFDLDGKEVWKFNANRRFWQILL